MPVARTIALMEKKAGIAAEAAGHSRASWLHRRADLTRLCPSAGSYFWLIVYLVLLLLVPATSSIPLLPTTEDAVPDAGLYRQRLWCEFRKRDQRDLDAINYSVRMIFAMNRIRSLQDPELDVQLQAAYESLDRLRSVVRIGGVSTVSGRRLWRPAADGSPARPDHLRVC